MFSAKYLKKHLTYPQQICYTEATEQDKGEDQIGWPWPYFQGHNGHLRQQHGFCSISKGIFDVSLPNSVQGNTRAKTKLEPHDLDLIYKVKKVIWGNLKWFLLNIWRNLWWSPTKFGTQRHYGKAETNLNLATLTSFSRSQMSFKVH